MSIPFTTRGDEALAIIQTRYQHSSTFVPLSDGRILQNVWGGGFCHSEDGGLTWSKPTGGNVRDDLGREKWCQCRDPDGNPVGDSESSLVKLNDQNSIGLASRSVETRAGSTYATTPRQYGFFFWRSDDNGQTWSRPVRMTAPGCNTAGYQDTFLRSSSGRILLPVFHLLGQGTNLNDRTPPISGKLYQNQWITTAGHYTDPSFTAVYVLYSDDEGRTWKRNEDGELTLLMDWNSLFSVGNECSMTEVAPGRLLLMMRNQLGRLFQAWSNDNGQSWTKPQPTVLAASTTPPQIRTLPSPSPGGRGKGEGHLLCIWNQETEAEVLRGDNRTRVSAAISRDGGRVWEFFQNIASAHEGPTRVEPGPIRIARPAELYWPSGHAATERDPRYVVNSAINWRGCYPSCLVLPDRVLVTHTSNHFTQHPSEARLVHSAKHQDGDGINQRLLVLPIAWFYGGKKPADNPFLRAAYEPAKP